MGGVARLQSVADLLHKCIMKRGYPNTSSRETQASFFQDVAYCSIPDLGVAIEMGKSVSREGTDSAIMACYWRAAAKVRLSHFLMRHLSSAARDGRGKTDRSEESTPFFVDRESSVVWPPLWKEYVR